MLTFDRWSLPDRPPGPAPTTTTLYFFSAAAVAKERRAVVENRTRAVASILWCGKKKGVNNVRIDRSFYLKSQWRHWSWNSFATSQSAGKQHLLGRYLGDEAMPRTTFFLSRAEWLYAVKRRTLDEFSEIKEDKIVQWWKGHNRIKQAVFIDAYLYSDTQKWSYRNQQGFVSTVNLFITLMRSFRRF